MADVAELPPEYIADYWEQVKSQLRHHHLAVNYVAAAAVDVFRRRFDEADELPIYNDDPRRIADTIAEQEQWSRDFQYRLLTDEEMRIVPNALQAAFSLRCALRLVSVFDWVRVQNLGYGPTDTLGYFVPVFQRVWPQRTVATLMDLAEPLPSKLSDDYIVSVLRLIDVIRQFASHALDEEPDRVPGHDLSVFVTEGRPDNSQALDFALTTAHLLGVVDPAPVPLDRYSRYVGCDMKTMLDLARNVGAGEKAEPGEGWGPLWPQDALSVSPPAESTGGSDRPIGTP